MAIYIARLLLFPAMLGTSVLTIAMWYFWFGFDRSSWVKKALWCLPLFLFVPIGPTLYCFFVYLRNKSLTENITAPEKSRKLAGAGLS
jgi:hypothetical protein